LPVRNVFIAGILATALAMLGCVTINVYFPEAAAQKAADQFIGNVLDQAPAPPKPAPKPATQPPSAGLLDLLIPAASAADVPDIRIQTAATQQIGARMQSRFRDNLRALLDAGAVGFGADGMLVLRDAAAVPLAQRTQAAAWVADDNRDRAALYREVASANGHPEWEAQIRATFARGWIERASPGWYYQTPAGAWQRK
jgi:uncharacterized protein YdbL (DUF1318 family)